MNQMTRHQFLHKIQQRLFPFMMRFLTGYLDLDIVLEQGLQVRYGAGCICSGRDTRRFLLRHVSCQYLRVHLYAGFQR